jgi:hypothetical protein
MTQGGIMRIHGSSVVVALIVVLSGSIGLADQKADISGTWNLAQDMGSRQGMQTFVFKQQGERLTGTANNGNGDQKVTGTVKGDKAVFSFEATREGRTLKGTYHGTIESATKMTGTVDFTGSITGSGTWTANKK